MYLDGNEWQNRVGDLRYYLERLTIATEIPFSNRAPLDGEEADD
jgi:hypothetical protein